jgi:hypothetical protein
MFAAIMLGLTVSVVGLLALFMWSDARDAREPAPAAAIGNAHDPAPAAESDVHAHTTAAGLESYAGVSPANAE